MRPTTLEEVDGLPICAGVKLPHPVDLGRWTDAGLLKIDCSVHPPRFRVIREQTAAALQAAE